MSEVEKRLAIVRRITTVMGDDIDFRNESHVNHMHNSKQVSHQKMFDSDSEDDKALFD